MAHFDSNIRFPQTGPSPRRGAQGLPEGRRRARRSSSGGGLASARDRQRLRERNAAERARVEAMLAAAPALVDLPGDRLCGQERVQPLLRAVEPATCPVCRQAKIVTDEVMHTGMLRVSECLHCEHRWTERPRSRWSEIGASMGRRGHSARPLRFVQEVVQEVVQEAVQDAVQESVQARGGAA